MKVSSERATKALSANSSLSGTEQQMQPQEVIVPYTAMGSLPHRGSGMPQHDRVVQSPSRGTSANKQ